MKLFVALDLPESLADCLLAMQENLPGARWVPFDNFHLTLAFIGEADRRLTDDIDSALQDITRPAPFVHVAGAGVFGDPRSRAVWAGVQMTDDLSTLQAKVALALRRAGVDLKTRRYTPHVTLGYLSGVARDDVHAWIAAHNLFDAGAFTARSFCLYASHPGQDGSYYEALAHYPLISSSR